MPNVKPPEHTTDVKQPGKLELLIEQAPMHGAPFWHLLQSIDPVEKVVNRALINKAINVLDPRPYRLSTLKPYTTYETLTDKKRNTRQLPGRTTPTDLPDLESVGQLFQRTPEDFVACEKSTVLFAYVAQWFTDGFLRSTGRDSIDTARDITHNESTHEVDLAQLYGLNECELEMLRDKNDRKLLAAHGKPGHERPPDLFAGGEVVPAHDGLRVIRASSMPIDDANLLAMGSDAANVQIGYAMLNTLFLRDHNWIAREIKAAHDDWEDDRIFGAARNVLTVLLIRVVIEEYINHIHPYHFRFRLDPRGFDKQRWMRPNWVAVEFNLLYRWHSLIPDTIDVGGDTPVDLRATMYKAKPLLSGPDSLATLIDRASRQRAGKVGLHNTCSTLVRAEIASVDAGREVGLCGYNVYRKACKLGTAKKFSDITSDPELAKELEQLYGRVNRVEYFVGLFAEDRRKNSVLPPLIGRLVGLHAFSQLMTNPLFAPQVYNTETFSQRGAEIIAETKCLADMVRRNIPEGSDMPEVRLTRKGWTPV